MTAAHGYILTAAEAADRLRVPVSTVRRWLWSSQLPGYRVGGMNAGWRIRESDIEQFRGSVSAPAADGNEDPVDREAGST